METGAYAQSCANAYRDIGEINGWRKGRNSSRGYDLLTVPGVAWDDRPHDRYLLVVHGHLSAGAAQLEASGGCFSGRNTSAAVPLARGAFVESSKAAWLLEDGIPWSNRAARAHLELLGNLDTHVRRLPKRLDTGHPNFRRKQWQVYRKQLRDEVIVDLFGKRALSRDGDEPTLVGEALLSSSQLEDRFAESLGDADASPLLAAPELLMDASAPVAARLDTPFVVDDALAQRALTIAIDEWLTALGAWVRYNAWDTGTVDRLRQQSQGLLGPMA